MTEPPDKSSDMPETPTRPSEASPWTPPAQPSAGGYAPHYDPPLPGPGGYPPPHPGFSSMPGPRNGLGVASLVLGLVAFALSWFFCVGFILGIGALATGIAGRGRVKRGEASNNGAAVAGILLGIFAIVIAIIIGVLVFAILAGHQDCLDRARGRAEYAQC
jgi:hypothetical protein